MTKYIEFKEKLDNNHDWPSLYMFKFIVPAGREDQVKELFPKNEVSLRPSSKGNYISATIQMMASSAEEIIEIYEEANTIEGIIAL